MAQSVLGSLTFGYRPLWNRARSLAGVRLHVHADDPGVDGLHILRTVEELWSAESPGLLLASSSRELLAGLLGHATRADAALEVPAAWLGDATLRAAVRGAHARGAQLVLAGTPDELRPLEAERWAVRRAVQLTPTDAATALQAARRARSTAAGARMAGRAADSPVGPDTLVDGVASRDLAEHALDQQGAWAVAGWPVEDMLHRYRGQPLPPTRRAIVQTMNALDAEQSLDRIELAFAQEPALAYRLLIYLNSAGLGLRSGIASLRHGFMMLGFRTLNRWLAEQLTHASDDASLRPVNTSIVVRSQLMHHLMDVGIEEDLRREIYLCGLFSQLDLVMDEPMRASLARIPLPDRIAMALLADDGPYAPTLQVACALESDDPAAVRALRQTYEMEPEDVNRALLRTLAALGRQGGGTA